MMNLLKIFWTKNRTFWIVLALIDFMMMWISYAHYHGEGVYEQRTAMHNLLIIANFFVALIMCWRLNFKLDDFKNVASNSDPSKIQAIHVLLFSSLLLFVAILPMFISLPVMCYLESADGMMFIGKFLTSFLCLLSLTQVFACGWCINMNNRAINTEQITKAPEQSEKFFLLTLFRSFIDFYFYYMMLACFGLFMYKMFGMQIISQFPNFRILDVVFCLLAADLMLVKAYYELSNKKAFLWSGGQSWGVDLPAGLIKVLTVSIVAVLLPMPTQEEAQKLAQQQKANESAPDRIPRYEDSEIKAPNGQLPAKRLPAENANVADPEGMTPLENAKRLPKVQDPEGTPTR